jgi:hypothetical protein
MAVETEVNTKWRNSRAKAALIRAINNGDVPLDPKKGPKMSLRDIYDSVDGCKRFDYSKFSSRLAAVRKKLRENEEPEEPATKWRNSRAKDLLSSAIIEGRVDPDQSMEDIYSSIEELKQYRFSKFEARYKSLLSQVENNSARATGDKVAFDDFLTRAVPSMFSHLGYMQWQGSRAQSLLRDDIKAELHLTMSKRDLWLWRDEYHEDFLLPEFRDKFWQEIRTSKYYHTLQEKGKKKVADW